MSKHGVASTAGHLSSNGGIRGHSAGDAFPFIVRGRGNPNELGQFQWEVVDPKGAIKSVCLTASFAERMALEWKRLYILRGLL